ncbi:MAG TPA: hypothetical protein VL978_18070 [Puia sp.]|nr:hypothetical protein [Puia sp.]
MIFKEAVLEYAEEPLPRQIMMDLLKEYKRPNDKINELVKKGELTAVKKGLYVAGPRITVTKPEPFLIANHLRGPSYLSLDAALSYWGLIPERVYEISSMTTKTSKSYKTPLGRFRYYHAPLPYYSFGIKSVELTPRQVALIASPEKALCDKIITTSGILLRSSRQVREYLIDDLRMDEEMLRKFDTEAISTWITDAPKKRSLSMLVNTIASL